jgi:hypothetical protein
MSHSSHSSRKNQVSGIPRGPFSDSAGNSFPTSLSCRAQNEMSESFDESPLDVNQGNKRRNSHFPQAIEQKHKNVVVFTLLQ